MTRFEVTHLLFLAGRFPVICKRLPPRVTLVDLVRAFIDSSSALEAIAAVSRPDAEDIAAIDDLLLECLWTGSASGRCVEILLLWLWRHRQ